MNTMQKTGIAAASLAGGMILAAAVRRAFNRYDFHNKSVVITGGSRGLGLLLARELGHQGARIAILAQDRDELARAEKDLRHLGIEVTTVACDLRQPDRLRGTLDQIVGEFGTVDVLVNNAGTIQVGPLDHMTEEDFHDAMAIHFWAAFYTMQAVIPLMRAKGGGRIVNISSIGGKIAVPHLAPYSASKFALAGLSEAMRAELTKEGIYITTVFPGLMRTGSHVNAMFKGRHRDEFTWFALFDALPGLSLNATRAARKIVESCRDGDPQLIVGIPAKLAVFVHTAMPNLSARLLQLMNRLLPQPSLDHGAELHAGWQSQSRWAPSFLTRLADRASARNNELK